MQQQLEFEFFFPLTDQTKLNLDFTPCEQWIAECRKKQSANSTVNWTPLLISNGGTGLTTSSSSIVMGSFVLRPDAKNVGKWEITDSMFVYIRTKPNAVVRFFAKFFLGFKWHDEI
jgi:hypothetical protein